MLSVMYFFMNKEKSHVGDDMSFTNSVIYFTKQIVEAWGENHITHYMVNNIFLSVYVIFFIFYFMFIFLKSSFKCKN